MSLKLSPILILTILFTALTSCEETSNKNEITNIEIEEITETFTQINSEIGSEIDDINFTARENKIKETEKLQLKDEQTLMQQNTQKYARPCTTGEVH